MTKLYLAIIMLLILTACGSSSDNESAPDVANPPIKELLKVACIGDSITEGTGLSNPSIDSYPSQLVTILGESYEVANFGIKSATVLKQSSKPYWNTSQYSDSHLFAPDIVVIMLGTNDAKPGNWVNKDQLVSDYSDLINTYKNLETKPTVYICYPPPIYGEVAGITDSRIRNELLPLLNQVSIQNNVSIIDNYSALSGNKGWFTDNVHPNTEGARIVAETVYQVIY